MTDKKIQQLASAVVDKIIETKTLPPFGVPSDEPPIDGGNLYSMKELLLAKEQVIRSTDTYKTIDSLFNNNQLNYNIWFLLHMQADYWSRLCKFKLDDSELVSSIYKAYRLACIYGKSLLWHFNDNVIAMYIESIIVDEYDIPVTLKVSKASNVLMQQDLNYKHETFDLKYDKESMHILNYSSLGIGGLIYWLPFLNQLELILKLFKNDVWSYYKKYEWKTGNSQTTDFNDLKSFVNPNYPFYVRTQAFDDPKEMGLKILGKEMKNEIKVKEYIDDFLDVYYSLFGRTFNNVKKKERNTRAEANAGVTGFETIQSEWILNCENALHWIQNKTGKQIQLCNEVTDAKDEYDDNNKPNTYEGQK